MSDEIKIRNYRDLQKTTIGRCKCCCYATLPKQHDQRNTNDVAARWANKIYCSKCGDKITLVETDLVAIDYTYSAKGLFGKSSKDGTYICLVDQSQPKCISLAQHDERKDTPDNLGKLIDIAVVDHLNGGALLE